MKCLSVHHKCIVHVLPTCILNVLHAYIVHVGHTCTLNVP